MAIACEGGDIDCEQHCRICLSNDIEDRLELLADVCACRGSQRFVHSQCLEIWRARCLREGRFRAWHRCTICRESFKVKRLWLRDFVPIAFRFILLNSSQLASFAVMSVLSSMLLVFVGRFSRAAFDDMGLWQHGANYLANISNCSIGVVLGAWYAIVEAQAYNPCDEITGAQLVYTNIGNATNTLILHGGWDDCNGPRNRLFSVSRENLIKGGSRAWNEIPIWKDGHDDCPSHVYGHTATVIPAMSTDTKLMLLIIGGHTAGGYRTYSDRWGLLEITSASQLQAHWRQCGHSKFARRAWHTATMLLGGLQVFLCGGSDGIGGMHAGILDLAPMHHNSSADPNFSVIEPGACLRQGHSAVLAKDKVIIIGGTSHVGPGIPWHGNDSSDITPFSILEALWLPSHSLWGDDVLLIMRQHTATIISDPSDVDTQVVLYGGGLGGQAQATLLTFWTNSSELNVSSAQPLQSIQLGGCTSNLPSLARKPSLRGHAAVWTGQELIVHGGADRERSGYFGIMIIVPAAQISPDTDQETCN